MTAGRLTHVRLLVDDFSASSRLDGDRLALPTPWEDNGAYAEFEAGDEVNLAILPRAEMAGAVPLRRPRDGILLVLDVGDVDAAAAGQRERGVAPVDEPHDRPERRLRVLRARDPDGNLVELFHDIDWTPE